MSTTSRVFSSLPSDYTSRAEILGGARRLDVVCVCVCNDRVVKKISKAKWNSRPRLNGMERVREGWEVCARLL